MKHTASQFTRGARIDGVTTSGASSFGVLSTSRGALLVAEGEWVVRVEGCEPFVLTDGEYRRAFAKPERERAPLVKREPIARVEHVEVEKIVPTSTRAPRALRPVAPPKPGDITRPRSTLASHAAANAYDGTDG